MDTYRYIKDISNLDAYDIVICGGGVSGFTAAVQAARMGCKTALIEKSAMLGGVLTAGGNNEIALFYAHGKQIISGIGWEMVKRLEAEDMARIPDFSVGIPHYNQGVIVNLPMAAQMMDKMCMEAGVELFFEQQLIDVIYEDVSDGRHVSRLVISSKEGLRVVEAYCFIDCTGDGDLCAFAGADYEKGEYKKNELQPGTLRFYPKGFRLSDISEKQVQEAFRKGVADQVIRESDYWSGNPYTIFSNNGNNINHIAFDSSMGKSRTEAEIEGRESLRRITKWAREYVTGAKDFYMDTLGMYVASRESRRIKGEAYITADDYINAKHYEDGVSYSFYPIDLHKDGDDTLHNVFLEEGRVPEIPLGAMIPKGFINVFTAGRCISGDRLSNSAFRVKASCMGMGQAAGAAAGYLVKNKTIAPKIDVTEVKSILKKEGAIVPE